MKDYIKQFGIIAERQYNWDGEGGIIHSGDGRYRISDAKTAGSWPNMKRKLGSWKKGTKDLGIEMFEKDRSVTVYSKDEVDNSMHEEFEM